MLKENWHRNNLCNTLKIYESEWDNYLSDNSGEVIDYEVSSQINNSDSDEQKPEHSEYRSGTESGDKFNNIE